MASSLNTITHALMALPTPDVAARSRVTADLAEYKRQLNSFLGIKQRGASVLAINEVIIDVFQFVRRQDLDTLQIVNRCFRAIVEKQLATVCLRLLKSVKISRKRAKRQFVLMCDEVGAKKLTRLPTGVHDMAAATTFLLDACQSSRLDSLPLYGMTYVNGHFFDSIALRAPTIFLKELRIGKRTFANGLPHDKVLRALQAFGKLETVKIEAANYAVLHDCLIRTCFKAGVRLVSDGLVLDKKSEGVIAEKALLDFCFGACDEQYAMRDRFLSIEVSKSLKSDFLQRWIGRAEVTDCRHKLTLDITFWQGPTSQDTSAVDAYKQEGQAGPDEVRFGSVSGRNWAVTCSEHDHAIGSDRMNFKINH
ncbi:hypothetical protein AAVH_25231 [Aphelenchoides avenae]|nr:hypothetical protein AAVH_25231 [Aphelenchus avenae]